MTEAEINAEYKRQFAEAADEHGGPFSVPREIVHRLQEWLRLQFVRLNESTAEQTRRIERALRAEQKADEMARVAAQKAEQVAARAQRVEQDKGSAQDVERALDAFTGHRTPAKW